MKFWLAKDLAQRLLTQTLRSPLGFADSKSKLEFNEFIACIDNF